MVENLSGWGGCWGSDWFPCLPNSSQGHVPIWDRLTVQFIQAHPRRAQQGPWSNNKEIAWVECLPHCCIFGAHRIAVLTSIPAPEVQSRLGKVQATRIRLCYSLVAHLALKSGLSGTSYHIAPPSSLASILEKATKKRAWVVVFLGTPW